MTKHKYIETPENLYKLFQDYVDYTNDKHKYIETYEKLWKLLQEYIDYINGKT